MIKRWDDAGYEQKRPDTITVTLLKDGTVYDTRTISRMDSWQYTWSGLPRYNPDGTEIVWTIQGKRRSRLHFKHPGNRRYVHSDQYT
ncbi:MAG: Cna B-type domain-containing protein [Oscillospiraceae bacterium]